MQTKSLVSAKLSAMATVLVEIHYIGCGDDLSKLSSKLSSKDRRNLGSDSTGDPFLRKQAISGWPYLLNKKLQSQGITLQSIVRTQERCVSNPLQTSRSTIICKCSWLSMAVQHIELHGEATSEATSSRHAENLAVTCQLQKV